MGAMQRRFQNAEQCERSRKEMVKMREAGHPLPLTKDTASLSFVHVAYCPAYQAHAVLNILTVLGVLFFRQWQYKYSVMLHWCCQDKPKV